MEKTMEIPDSVLEQLKCAHCDNYLSHPPIYHHPLVGFICGRHSEQVGSNRFLRQTIYEVLASLLLFPCCYKQLGCTEHFTMKDMVLHEMICSFKPHTCPVNKCAWHGCNKKLASHFYDNHKPITVVDKTAEIDLVLEKNMKMDMLIVAFGQYFMVRFRFRKITKTFQCSILLLKKEPNDYVKSYQYEISIKTKDGRFSWPAEKCMVQTYCSQYQKKYECRIRLASLNSISQIPIDVVLGIKLTELNSRELVENADEILETIKCPICLEYMVPPIHQCIIGHSFCNTCKPKLDKCPTCRNQIRGTRNFTLESVTEKVTFDCLYKTEGCTFKTNSSNIQKHQLSCKFRISSCILSDVIKCNFVGPQIAMNQHCCDAHSNFVQKEPIFEMIYVPYFANFDIFLIKFDFESMFKVRYGYNEENVTCSVQSLSPPGDEANYMYEMEIIDQTDSGFELKSKKMCANLSDDRNDMKFCTMWHLDMIKPFISGICKLKFKCTISKKN